ncbi:hypothetical protein OH76DRAFT_86840 [Lentinus brumalis]|uniref:PHD-type domain-containing protein n=1 Tax=Lentinus brumalis TaxID=2498619 RepID=A0A371CQU4_9APHY|nr:hypothetical protein OH76DRAFT_86840 [Polyporus brumalis]
MASVEGVPAYLHPGASVSQPPHLEGDPSLATEILPGPPSLATIQQAASGIPKKDNKKPTVTYSYLPTSDPGTTYTTHFALGSISAAPTDMDGTRRKRARLDKGAESTRSQRASARSLAVVSTPSDPIIIPEATASSSHALSDFDPALLPLDSDDAMVSRATSLHEEDTPPEVAESSTRPRGRPSKDKRRGKGKEREREPAVKVKEEPGVVSLDNVPSLSNEDHCSACRSLGALVYCDGCPRAFHWLCLDPPMEASDLPEGESRWFCPACVLEQRPSPKPPTSLKFMAPLVHELANKIPTEYQLPQDIRSFFKDVGTGPRGTYQDMSEVKQPRFNRHGQLEDRDPYRLKDRNGDPMLCFRCGTSALPPGMAADSPTVKRARRSASTNVNNYETGRAIISCDYCHLHWHLDCLDPPLSVMPPWSKKWMCPNHAERVLQPKRRIPRANATPIDITKPRQWNNGNIEVVQADTAPSPARGPDKLNVDEVLINGRRYRVPERIITLDFWDKIARNRRGESASEMEYQVSSLLSSPLTSLSSLADDQESITPLSIDTVSRTQDDVNIAQMLCDMQLHGSSSSAVHSADRAKSHTNGAHKVKAKTVKIEPQEGTLLGKKGVATSGSISAETSRPRRAAASHAVSSRARSSRRSGRSGDEDVPMDVDFELPPLVISSGKRPDARRKAARPPEPVTSVSQTSVSIANGVHLTTAEGDKTPTGQDATESLSISSRSKRTRQPARGKTRAEPTIKPDPDQMDTDLSILAPPPPKASSSKKKKANGTSARHRKPITPPTTNGSAPNPTPTLKIRLPRIGAFTSPSIVNAPSTATDASKASPTKATPSASTVAGSRPRRSLRRQTSVPTPLNSASVSEAGSSSRVNDVGLSASPIESF